MTPVAHSTEIFVARIQPLGCLQPGMPHLGQEARTRTRASPVTARPPSQINTARMVRALSAESLCKQYYQWQAVFLSQQRQSIQPSPTPKVRRPPLFALRDLLQLQLQLQHRSAKFLGLRTKSSTNVEKCPIKTSLVLWIRLQTSYCSGGCSEYENMTGPHSGPLG